MGKVYELMDDEEARRVLKKLQAMWNAEAALKVAILAHDGSDRSYRALDQAAATYTQARFRWQLTADLPPTSEGE